MPDDTTIMAPNAFKNKGFDLVILAGGQASRLGDLGVDTPKSMLKILQKPFLCWQIESFLRANMRISRIFIIIRASDIQAFTPLKSALPVPVTLIPETSPRGTGGALLDIAQNQDLSSLFYAANGDVLFYANPDDLILSAATHGAAMQYLQVSNAAQLGGVRISGSLISALIPPNSHNSSGHVNAGLYAFKRDVLKKMASQYSPSSPCSFERELAPFLIKSGQMGAVFTTSPFIDIGTPSNYVAADAFCKKFAAKYLSQINLATLGW